MCPKDSKKNTDAGASSRIGEALFPKVRRKVLALFFLDPEKRYYFRETARLLDESPGSIQRELKLLTNVGILTSEQIGIQQFYQANPECPIFGELRAIAEKTFGIVDRLKEGLSRIAENHIEVAWIYGSIPGGDDSSTSDIDLLVIGTLSFRKLISTLQPIEDDLHRPLNPTLFTPEEFKTRLAQENNFVQTVMKSPKIFVVGDDDDLEKLAE